MNARFPKHTLYIDDKMGLCQKIKKTSDASPAKHFITNIRSMGTWHSLFWQMFTLQRCHGIYVTSKFRDAAQCQPALQPPVCPLVYPLVISIN